jgi:hypothetical protein
LLKAVVNDTDFLDVDPDSNLVIDGIPAAEIIQSHGSPLFVIGMYAKVGATQFNVRSIREETEDD